MAALSRRTFVKSTAASMIAARLGAVEIGRHTKSLSILMLGGTGYVGPEIVQYAVDRGHEVTLFNRGETNPHLFSGLETLRGNRFPDRGEGLRALAGERAWDVVIDTWQGSPVLIEETARLLRNRTSHYVYVSSAAVYGGRNYRTPGVDETTPLPETPPMPQSADAELSYPVRKILGEAAVARHFPERHSLHRAHSIVGCLPNGDVSGLPYWAIRFDQGGEILAPGSPSDTTQWIDVKDLAQWIVTAAERQRYGAWNVFRTQRWDEYLYGLKAISDAESTLVWVPATFLFEVGMRSFTDIPGWVSHDEVEGSFYRLSDRKAREAGLSVRAMADTFTRMKKGFYAHHSVDEFRETSPEKGIAVLEAAVLERWKRRGKDPACR